ncbi:hypothetical protein [Helicobacter fennelliae]|uniref:Uncharacterized protein n=2 Tax=Helicobacter fennelliae TaxID=215 RepID=T1CW83_9HELI|nr:hypothetical protein [Helicobacter fennelliae]GAD18090.1 hypothetical protein HFN_1688 [Helicobacter fennelliae MRY12-0050]SQB98100.1 Uncharacterised protein [Helicobacter fennelliae]STP06688.1 Uncharacterised protein [Helicobacter fennelliae]
MDKAIVFGASGFTSGFIGLALTKALLKNNINVQKQYITLESNPYPLEVA